jgi:hypothetical protein
MLMLDTREPSSATSYVDGKILRQAVDGVGTINNPEKRMPCLLRCRKASPRPYRRDGPSVRVVILTCVSDKALISDTETN